MLTKKKNTFVVALFTMVLFTISYLILSLIIIIPVIFSNYNEIYSPMVLASFLIVFLLIFFSLTVFISFFQYTVLPLLFLVIGIFYIKNSINIYWFGGLEFIIFLIAFFLYSYFPNFFGWKEPNWWILAGIVLILVLLVLGLPFINSFYKENKMSLVFYNLSNMSQSTEYNMSCLTHDEKTIEGQYLHCKINPEVDNLNGTINYFTYENGQIDEIINNTSSLWFKLPKETLQVQFSLDVSKNNNTQKLYALHDANYPDLKGYDTRRTNFFSYILALFAFCFVSVPLVIYNLKEISKKSS